jgi:hypothetical protein
MSSASPWPDHLLTLAEWDALPERQFELQEGVLRISAARVGPPGGRG